MKRFGIRPVDPVKLSSKQEIEVTFHIASIVKENKYKVTTFNICCDHIHLILFCCANELENIMKNIKSTTSRKFNKLHKNKLWAQKFNRRVIENEDQLGRVINYIENNRTKHDLPENEKLQRIIKSMLTSFDDLIQ